MRKFLIPLIGLFTLTIFILFSESCTNKSCTDCTCQEEVCAICEVVICEIHDKFEEEFLSDGDGYQKIISDFHKLNNRTGSAENVESNVDLYFDLSDGMKYKIKDAGGNDGLLSYLLNVIPSKSKYFKLTANGFAPLNEKDPKVYVKQAKHYTAKGNYAQLDSTIAEIARNNTRQSVLVTDGELAVQGLTSNYLDVAWAKEHFTKWLRAENRIDFVVQVIGNERLFFIIFTPRKIATGSGNSVIKEFIKSTENAGKSDEYKRLAFTINDYQLEKLPDTRPAIEKGINSTMIDWMGTDEYKRYEHLNENYEHYFFTDQVSFQRYVNDFSKGIYQEDFVKELKENNKLFYNLRLTNEFINYQIAHLGIQVEDITNSFNTYTNYLKCKKSKSIEEEDENGDKQMYWCNPWGDCKDPSTCQYHPVNEDQSVREIFELHEESTIQQGGNFNTANISIKPAKNFNAETWNNIGLFKVGIFIKEVTYSNKQDFDILKWEHNNGQNTGLSESIRLAMQELEPKNKLIYTYYFTYPIVID